MQLFIWIVQIVAAILLIALILMHSPKGDGIASFGGTSQLFSSQKSTEKGLNKVTYFFVGIFIFSTFMLGFILKQESEMLNKIKNPVTQVTGFFVYTSSEHISSIVSRLTAM